LVRAVCYQNIFGYFILKPIIAANTMSESDATMSHWLADHPRMMGALFTLVLLLSSAGNAVTGAYTTTAGP
jgi:hypothetical protein